MPRTRSTSASESDGAATVTSDGDGDEVSYPELEPLSYSEAIDAYDTYQKRGYVVAAELNEPFSYDGSEYDEGVLVIPDDDSPAFVLDKLSFHEQYVSVPPSKHNV